MRSLWMSLGAASGLGLAICVSANAQPPLVPMAPQPPAVVGSQTVIRGSGNGFGNTIIVDNQGFGPSSTVIENTRNGFGNKVTVINNGQSVVLTDPPCYRGKANAFWNTKLFCDSLGCTVYYCPKAAKWYIYLGTEDAYRPLPEAWQRLVDLEDF